MGNIVGEIMNTIIVLSATTGNEEAGVQFPFLAALLLIVIVVAVSVGDMVKVNKHKEEEEKQTNKDSNHEAKM